MVTLVLITLALSFASFAIVALLHRGFVRSVSWFDNRNAEKERARIEAHRSFLAQRRKRTPEIAPHREQQDDTEEWAEYIDV